MFTPLFTSMPHNLNKILIKSKRMFWRMKSLMSNKVKNHSRCSWGSFHFGKVDRSSQAILAYHRGSLQKKCHDLFNEEPFTAVLHLLLGSPARSRLTPAVTFIRISPVGCCWPLFRSVGPLQSVSTQQTWPWPNSSVTWRARLHLKTPLSALDG